MTHCIDERKNEVIEDYQCGGGISFICRKYKCTKVTALRRLKKWGVYKADKFRGPLG